MWTTVWCESRKLPCFQHNFLHARAEDWIYSVGLISSVLYRFWRCLCIVFMPCETH